MLDPLGVAQPLLGERRMRPAVLLLAVLLTLAAEGRARANPACSPSRLMLVLDKSSSMQTGTINGVTKWNIAKNALDTVVTEYENTIEIGLTTFPQPSECSPGSVDVAPALGTRATILAALAGDPPEAGNWTPMAQTLEAVALEPSLVGTTSNKYAVLITDGWQWCSPYDPSTRFLPVQAIASLNAAGVTTYVVGFGAGADALTLNSMAVEAGTAKPGCDPTGDTPSDPDNCYYQADDPAQLVAALQSIAVSVSSETCDGLDNDCDGQIDEQLTRSCDTACGAGTETCTGGTWQGCDAPPVETEICDGADNDCDGVIDPGCECADGDTRPCGGADACSPGVQTCQPDGTWGGCEGAVDPVAEMCDGIDNDCDGQVDESSDEIGNLCGPGLQCVDGGCGEIDPGTPPGDDPGADGQLTSNCACSGAVDPRGAAGSALCLLLAGFLVTRRRERV